MNVDLLAEAIDAHLEHSEEANERLSLLEAADAWGIGTIAFLLLCGYPPFFAPCRYAILARIDKTDFSFDPPFWSKISEEAKDFVQQCLRAAPERRMTISEALEHPWIQSLADTSPSGSMLNSFAANLRRFYRTSLIEGCAANSLAAKLSYREAHEFHSRCCDADQQKSGFLTATDLRQVLMTLGHGDIAEAVAVCFSRMLRHPGESYIDYQALSESARLRRERLLEEELWHCFKAFSDSAGVDETGRLPVARLRDFFQVSDVRKLLIRSGATEDFSELLDSAAGGCLLRGSPASGTVASDGSPLEVDFIDIASEVVRCLPSSMQIRKRFESGPNLRRRDDDDGAVE